MTRPRGFVAIPGDAFGDDEEPRASAWRRLLQADEFWLGVAAGMTPYAFIGLLDAIVRQQWLATAAWALVIPWLAVVTRRRWRRWTQEGLR